MKLSLEDKFDIHELISRYGFMIDHKNFDRLNEIFTQEAILEFVGFDFEPCHGLSAIQQMMRNSTQHPLAHHSTNVVIDVIESQVQVLSKGIGVGHQGKVGSVTYTDQLESTTNGWRIAHRLCELRQS